MLTGCLWNACEAVEHLPQNNLQVTCKIMQREESLVLDALQEIEQVFYFSFKKTNVFKYIHLMAFLLYFGSS